MLSKLNFSLFQSSFSRLCKRNFFSLSHLEQKVTFRALAILSVIALVFASLCCMLIPTFSIGQKLRVKLFMTGGFVDLDDRIKKIITHTSQFNHYKVGLGTPYETILTGITLRPATLFFKALFEMHKKNAQVKKSQEPELEVTLPGKGKLFAINHPDILSHFIRTTHPDVTINFSAKGHAGDIYTSTQVLSGIDLEQVFGDKNYQISFQELQQTLNSQKIYLSPALPLKFYQELKASMVIDGIVTLPGIDPKPLKLKDLNTHQCKILIDGVQKNPSAYGFESLQECRALFELTLYQVGSMVIKAEDFRIFMDGAGKMIERKAGKNDAIQLINACGIRGIRSKDAQINKKIMTDTFKTALTAAREGVIVFPAVGMGVWGGDPDLYWRAFLDAVVASGNNLEHFFINPGHQPTPKWSIYHKRTGDEFAEILQEYIDHYQQSGNQIALQNLKKIVNLFDKKTDLVQLAHNLKVAYPDKIISLFNASDPDVTLGNHVGQYTNNCPHMSTTEENYTAMGTNGLCFENMTGVHIDPKRVISVSFDS